MLLVVDSSGTARGGFTDADLHRIVRSLFDLTPAGIARCLNLKQPMYRATVTSAEGAGVAPLLVGQMVVEIPSTGPMNQPDFPRRSQQDLPAAAPHQDLSLELIRHYTDLLRIMAERIAGAVLMLQRDFRHTERLLIIIDGAKGIAKGGCEVFGDTALIQC